jgi:hypothetical protein
MLPDNRFNLLATYTFTFWLFAPLGTVGRRPPHIVVARKLA